MDREVGREPGKVAVQEKWNEENKRKIITSQVIFFFKLGFPLFYFSPLYFEREAKVMKKSDG